MTRPAAGQSTPELSPQHSPSTPSADPAPRTRRQMRSGAASAPVESRRSRRVRPAEETTIVDAAAAMSEPLIQKPADDAVLADAAAAASARRARRAVEQAAAEPAIVVEASPSTPAAAPLSRRARRLAAAPAAEAVDAPIAEAAVVDAAAEPATSEAAEPTVLATAADEASAEPVAPASEIPGVFTATVTNPIPTMSTFDDIIAQAIRAEEPGAAPGASAAHEASTAAPEPASSDRAERAVEDHVGEKHVRRRRPRSFRRIAAKVTSVSALAAAGLLAVATSLPANALLTSADVQAEQQAAIADGSTVYGTDAVQSLTSASGVSDAGIERDSYGVMSANEAAAEEGITPESGTFTNDPNGTIQWPFAVGVHIGSGYGPRAGCSIGCSTNHMGQDFNPGYGARIQAIADGVVVESTDSGGAYGVKIVIEHEIDGQTIRSLYGHMISGSRQVEVGDRVTVGQYIGQTGSTGISTGAHLHLEIFVNGTNVDPLAWLYENAN